MFSFEDKIKEIDLEINKRKGKWQLSSLAHMDYSDVAQIIRLHIYNKWSLWDQKRPLANWLNRIISNQIINLVEENYSSFAPPCNSCPYNMGSNLCSYTKSGERCSECPLFAKWQKKKQSGYNIRLAISIDSEDYIEKSNFNSFDGNEIDYDKCIEKIHELIRPQLTKTEEKIYDLLIVQKLSEEEIAKELGFKTNEEGRKPGYKRIRETQNKFVKLTREIIKNHDIIL